MTHCEEEDHADASKDCPNYRALKDFTVPNRPVELFVYPPDPRRIQELTNEIIEASQEREENGDQCRDVTYTCTFDVPDTQCPDEPSPGQPGGPGPRGEPGARKGY